MHYKVAKKYARSPDILCAEFDKLAEAIKYAEQLVEEHNAAISGQCTYRVYEYDELMHEYDPESVISQAASTSGSSGGQGQTSSASFKPTPFNMSPRPGGTPAKWVQDAKDEDEKNS